MVIKLKTETVLEEQDLKAEYCCIEDKLLDDNVLKLLAKHHQEKIISVVRHSNNFGVECDAYIKIGKTVNRTIGIELKDVDLSKVVEQAIKRRELFNYSYIITNTSLSHFWSAHYFMYRKHLLGKLYKNSIGWIINDKIENKAVLIVLTRLKLMPLQKFNSAQSSSQSSL